MPVQLKLIESDTSLPERGDVAIVGGGIIGASAGYHLSVKGISVAILEKGRVGAEQSSRNWGWCRRQGRDKAELPLMMEALPLWEELQKVAPGGLGFRRNGILNVTKD